MNIIKANYNNAYIKKPQKLLPSFYVYALPDENKRRVLIQIDPKLNQESFYDDYKFEIKIDDIVVAYATKSTGTTFELELDIYEDENTTENTSSLDVTGYYTHEGSKVYEFGPLHFSFYLTPICSDELVCSEELYVYDIE